VPDEAKAAKTWRCSLRNRFLERKSPSARVDRKSPFPRAPQNPCWRSVYHVWGQYLLPLDPGRHFCVAQTKTEIPPRRATLRAKPCISCSHGNAFCRPRDGTCVSAFPDQRNARLLTSGSVFCRGVGGRQKDLRPEDTSAATELEPTQGSESAAQQAQVERAQQHQRRRCHGPHTPLSFRVLPSFSISQANPRALTMSNMTAKAEFFS